MENNQIAVLVAAVGCIFIVVGMIKGAARTFRRNWLIALFFMFLLPPIWLLWAVFEAVVGGPTRPRTRVQAQDRTD